MKPPLAAFLLILLPSIPWLPAAPGDGLTLNIGTGPNRTTTGSGTGVFGEDHVVNLTNSVIVGESHGSVMGFGGTDSIIVGFGNFYDNGGFVTNSSVIAGTDTWSVFNAAGEPVGPIANSVVAGASNAASITSGLVAGVNNYAVGRTFLLGDGLIADAASPAVIVGQYNDETITGTPRFVVGNGSATSRRNALEVYDDGTVKVPKRQGDVGMGRFAGKPADQ